MRWIRKIHILDLGRMTKFISLSKDPASTEYFRVNVMLVAVLVTAILMWSYSLNSYFTIGDFFHLKKLCFVYSLVHLLSPFLYKLTGSIRLVTHVFISAGFLFQFHHAMATGGFNGDTLILFSILPLIVGIVASLIDMYVWALISVLGVLLQYLLTYQGYAVNDISEAGQVWAKFNISMGYIMINLALIIAYIRFRDYTFQALQDKQTKIRSLVRILAHDINNPLGIIIMGSDLLREKVSDNPEVDKYLRKINIGAQHIKNIVSSTREYEQLTSTNLKLIEESVNISEAVYEAIEILEDKLREKGLRVIVNLTDEMNVKVNRSAFISQVLLNILSNALKFSFEDNQILIEGKSIEKFYELKISDYGLGMSQEVMESIFSDYIITSTPGTKGEKGTGFGMVIAYQVIKQFNGDLQVTSSQTSSESGTTFTLRLLKN